MCGIAGILGSKDLAKAEQTMQSMVKSMEHRGPDAQGTFIDNDIALGHTRLSIIDLNSASNQPFHSQDGRYVMIYNGEVYNYMEVRNELNEFQFTTASDTEVILNAFIKWGPSAFQKLNGMFACAIWDSEERSLFLIRDRLGIKPLYYAQSGDCVVFGSEVRSILRSGLVAPKLNHDVIGEYLMYQCVHAPNTMVKGIRLLEPGSYIMIDDEGLKVSTYWKPWQSSQRPADSIQIQKDIRDLLTQSTERRLIADVPVGAFLSGGIDSSLLVGILSERLGKKVDTFNVSFDESEFSEAKYAREIAGRFQTNHAEIKLNPSDFLQSLPSALSSQDHPSGDGPNSWIVSRETKKQGISVALSGLGGDELFAGYDVFKRIPKIADNEWLVSFPKPLRSAVANVYSLYRPGIQSEKLKQILTADYFDLQHLYPIFRKVLLERQVARLLNIRPTGNAVARIVSELEQFDGFETLPTLSRISCAEFSSYMQNVLLRDTDQMSMAHALEVRVPFLDHTLVEYVMHVPDQFKFPHQPKQLLVNSFRDILPESITNRKKMGFVLPWKDWMKGELKHFCEERLEFLMETGVVDKSALDRLWSDFQLDKPNISWSRLWPLVSLAHWMKENNIEA